VAADATCRHGAGELLLLSDRLDARRCEQLGLVNRVGTDSDLRAAAFALAKRLADGPAAAIGFTKDNLDHALTSDFLSLLDQEADRMVLAARTMDHQEAVRAFVERRQPAFRGE